MRLKNLFLVFGFFIVIGIFVGEVSAVCSVRQITAGNPLQSSERVIFEVQSETNAHGADFSGSPVNGKWYVVCPTSDVGTDAADYTCSSTLLGTSPWQYPKDKVIGLSSASNAHAQIPSGDQSYGQTNNICFRNLECTYGATCPSGYFGVISLSDATNAHIGRFSDSYPYKICCKDTAVVQPCSDECSPNGKKEQYCSDNNLLERTCGPNYDADTCLEWSTISLTDCQALNPKQECVGNFALATASCVTYCGNGVIDLDVESGVTDECDLGSADNGNTNLGCNLDCTIMDGFVEITPNKLLTMFWANNPTSQTPLSIPPSKVGDNTNAVLIAKGSLLKGLSIVNYEILEADGTRNTGELFGVTDETGVLTGSGNGVLTFSWKTVYKAESFGIGGDKFPEYIFSIQSLSINNGNKLYSNIVRQDATGIEWDGMIKVDEPATCVPTETCGPLGLTCGTYDDSCGVTQTCGPACTIPSSCDGTWSSPEDPGVFCDGTPTPANCINCQCGSASGFYPDGNGGCVSDPGTGCEQHDGIDLATCENDPYILRVERGIDLYCTEVTINKCKWTASDSTCRAGPISVELVPLGCGPGTPNRDLLDCRWNTKVEGDCSAGAEDVRFTYSYASGPDICRTTFPPAEIRVCPQRVLLPFFTWINFLIAIIVIAIVYYLLLHFGKKKKKRK